MPKPPEKLFRVEDFHPSFLAAFNQNPLNLEKQLMAALPVKPQDEDPDGPVKPIVAPREAIMISDGKDHFKWQNNSLRSLFRGEKQPPVLGDYPQAYEVEFFMLETHFLELCGLIGDRRDEEMLEIYSALRRRPDGRSLGFAHDHMWRASAILLGMRPLSQAEYSAILSRLEVSCRRFREGPSSRNMAQQLRLVYPGY